jgi:ribosomal protein L29
MSNELKTKTVEQIEKEISDMREKLRVIRFGGAGSRSRNVKEGRNLRREVARGLTELRERTLPNKRVSASSNTPTIASETKKA